MLTPASLLGGMPSIEAVASLSGSLSFQIVETVEGADYEKLENLPKINGVIVKGDQTSEELKIKRGYDATVDPADEEHLILSF